MKKPTINNVKLTNSERASFDLAFVYDCLSAKVIADADHIATPTKKNGAHPVHLKGRDRSMMNKRFGAKAKKDRKGRGGIRVAEDFDLCSYHNGKEFSAKKRSTLIEEEYDPEKDEILSFYGAADVNDLLRLIDEAWEEGYNYDVQYWELRADIEKKTACRAADNLKKYVLRGCVADPALMYKNEYMTMKAMYEDEYKEEFEFLKNSSDKSEEYAQELEEVYEYLTKRN